MSSVDQLDRSCSRPRPAPAEGGARGASERSERALVTMGTNASPAGQRARRTEWRTEAHRLRKGLWEITGLKALRGCGRYTHAGSGGPGVRTLGAGEKRRAGIAGLQSCASPWACPVCSRKIATGRAEDLRRVVEVVAERGGCGALITMTLRHNKSHSLKECWDALGYAWSKVTSGKHHAAETEQWGVIGWARAVEVTYGEVNGWHTHVHVAVFFDEPTSLEMQEELAARWWGRWERALNRRGFTADAERGGLDVRALVMTGDTAEQVARYFNKIGTELSGHVTKHGRRGNRSMFQVLSDGLDTGDADDLERWFEYEQTSKNRRQMTWSRGLREWADVGRRRSDEEIADEDSGGELVFMIHPEDWPAVRDRVPELLEAVETDGADGGKRWLEERGWRWLPTPEKERGKRRS